MQQITSYYPVLMVEDISKVKHFFIQYFDFEVVFDSEWYVHLTMKNQKSINLAFVQFNHESVPIDRQIVCKGVLLNIEVDDIQKEYDRLKDVVPIALSLKEEAWGQKHFIVDAPSGILVDVIKVIAHSEEFQSSYV